MIKIKIILTLNQSLGNLGNFSIDKTLTVNLTTTLAKLTSITLNKGTYIIQIALNGATASTVWVYTSSGSSGVSTGNSYANAIANNTSLIKITADNTTIDIQGYCSVAVSSRTLMIKAIKLA